MTIPTLEGITSKTITTSRLTTRVLFAGPENGVPVLFLHGNLSSATWWEETMLALPAGFRGVALDMRGYGDADPEQLIDATRGAGDWADDAVALLDELGIEKTHLVGNSLGSMVVWRLMADASDRILSATQISPGSPYGFGGTKDVDGTPCHEDFVGSGGGLINPEFLRLLSVGDDGTDSPFSPRNAFRALVVKPGFMASREDDFIASMLTTHLGDKAYAGDSTPSANWPHVAPGVWGPNNALSPKYVTEAVTRLLAAEAKTSVLWIRGANDLTVADTAAADMGTLGMTGVVPGWPGAEIYPPQPMLSQTRTVLEKYSASGGSFEEAVLEDCAHVCYIEKPDAFNQIFHKHIQGK